MIRVVLNGRERELEKPCSIGEFVASLDLHASRVAVERNGEIVPKAKYRETQLAEGDRLEIVEFVGGG
ncbi:MAG: sulfur carrier protein ThiS [Acidobacteriota bacterium]